MFRVQSQTTSFSPQGPLPISVEPPKCSRYLTGYLLSPRAAGRGLNSGNLTLNRKQTQQFPYRNKHILLQKNTSLIQNKFRNIKNHKFKETLSQSFPTTTGCDWKKKIKCCWKMPKLNLNLLYKIKPKKLKGSKRSVDPLKHNLKITETLINHRSKAQSNLEI